MTYIRVYYEEDSTREELVDQSTLRVFTRTSDGWILSKTPSSIWITQRPAQMGGTVRHMIPSKATLLKVLLHSVDIGKSSEVDDAISELSL